MFEGKKSMDEPCIICRPPEMTKWIGKISQRKLNKSIDKTREKK
jgi:hypothetical protein